MHGCPGSAHPPRGGDALAWLLHHPSVPPEVAAHFWHLDNGEACDCEATKRV